MVPGRHHPLSSEIEEEEERDKLHLPTKGRKRGYQQEKSSPIIQQRKRIKNHIIDKSP